MAKDPAILFYYQDFLTGTSFMTDSEVGQYIKILCHLADKDRLTKKQVLSICKASAIPENIQDKLLVDSEGYFYQKRMKEEKEKRLKFTESRRNNAKGVKAYAKHMEDGNENIINNEEIQKLWIRTFGRNPKLPEIDETSLIIEKFGMDKTYLIMKQAVLNNFKSIKTLRESLDDEGNIRPKDRGKNPRGSIDIDKYERELATIKPAKP